MKKIISSGLIAGIVLLVLSIGMLYAMILALPNLAEQYYNPIFRSGGERNMLFYLHPFVLGLALAWFWDRFKDKFTGSILLRGFELGLVYGVVAILPTMWITFSAINISITMVATWLLYGFLQAVVAGILFSWLNPAMHSKLAEA